MNYKSALLISLIAACPTLHGLVNLGEGQINLSVTNSLEYDSEIRSRNLGQSDTILSIRPSLAYIRPSKNFSLKASVGALVQRYFDYNEYDDENFFFDFNISPNADVEKSRFTFSGDILFNSETRSNDQIGEIVTTQNYGVSGQLTYHPNRHYSLIGSASWDKSDPQSNVYQAIENTSAGLSAQLPVNANINWFAGIDVRNVQPDSSTTARSESNIWIYSTGITGVLLPKLEGSLSIGYQERSFDSGRKTDTPYYSASLTWAIDDLSRVSLAASTDMGTTLNDLATESNSVTVSYSRSIRQSMSISVGLGYDISKFQTAGLQLRKDEAFKADASLSYQVNRWAGLNLFVNYSDRTSDSNTFEYDRMLTGLRLTGNW